MFHSLPVFLVSSVETQYPRGKSAPSTHAFSRCLQQQEQHVIFFTSSCASENNPKSHAASVHSHMHMVFFLGALPTCSLFHARGLLEWLLCSVCPAHPLCSPSILYKLSRKSNLLKHLLQPAFLYVFSIT